MFTNIDVVWSTCCELVVSGIGNYFINSLYAKAKTNHRKEEHFFNIINHDSIIQKLNDYKTLTKVTLKKA